MPLPTPPGPRIAYDKDGTLVFVRSTTTSTQYKGSVVQAAPRSAQALNSVFDPPAFMGASQVPNPIPGNPPEDPWVNWDYLSPTPYLIFLFPAAMQLQGILFWHYLAATDDGKFKWTLESSVNTTNGLDGDWVGIGSYTGAAWTRWAEEITGYDQYGNPIRDYEGVYKGYEFATGTLRSGSYNTGGPLRFDLRPYYRQTASANNGKGITALSGMGTRNVIGLRMRPGDPSNTGGLNMFGFMQVLLYGVPETDNNADYLGLWQSDFDLPINAGYLDFGDVAQGSTSDKNFRLKNLSKTRTANGITLTSAREAAQPEPESTMLFSTDLGVTWSSTVEIGSLSPESVSQNVRVRRVTANGVQLGPDQVRIDMIVGSWS